MIVVIVLCSNKGISTLSQLWWYTVEPSLALLEAGESEIQGYPPRRGNALYLLSKEMEAEGVTLDGWGGSGRR